MIGEKWLSSEAVPKNRNVLYCSYCIVNNNPFDTEQGGKHYMVYAHFILLVQTKPTTE